MAFFNITTINIVNISVELFHWQILTMVYCVLKPTNDVNNRYLVVELILAF